jgi:hypothetical protein
MNAFMWNKVLDGWSKSTSEHKVRRCRKLLDKMNDCANRGVGGSKPDIISYNTVLNAASFPSASREVRQDALLIAKTTFDEIARSSHVKPDDITYRAMLKFSAGGQDEKRLVEKIQKVMAERELNAALTK